MLLAAILSSTFIACSDAFNKFYRFKDLTGCMEYSVRSGQSYEGISYHHLHRFRNNKPLDGENARIRMYYSGEDDVVMVLSSSASKHWDFCKYIYTKWDRFDL